MYLVFCISDTMFPLNCVAKRRSLTDQQFARIANAEKPLCCVSPKFHNTLKELNRRYGTKLCVANNFEHFTLAYGPDDPDSRMLLVNMQFRRRASPNYHLKPEELAEAQFSFCEWSVE